MKTLLKLMEIVKTYTLWMFFFLQIGESKAVGNRGFVGLY